MVDMLHKRLCVGSPAATHWTFAHSQNRLAAHRAATTIFTACLPGFPASSDNPRTFGAAPFLKGELSPSLLVGDVEAFDNTVADGYVGHLDEQFLSSFPTWMRGTP